MTVDTARSGIDLAHLDAGVRPQDDLFGHLNGRWLAEYAIPADRATDGAFRTLYDRAEEHVRDLITEAAAAHWCRTDEQRVGDLYGSFLDEQTVEGRGLQPLLDELTVIDTADGPAALAAVVGRLQRTGVGGGVGSLCRHRLQNSSRYLLHLYQSGLGLPDESYYRDDQHAAILGAYPRHIAEMFALVFGGTADEYAERAGRIVALETKLAAAMGCGAPARCRSELQPAHLCARISEQATGFDWDQWAGALGLPETAVAELVVRQPDYLNTFAGLWRSSDFADWQDWLRWRLIHARAAVLTPALVEQDFGFYGRTLSGTEQIRERWKRAVSLVESLMGDAVGRLYVERHFPPEAKARMDVLVENLREAYQVSITDLEWMTPETRQRALAKLDRFTRMVLENGAPRIRWLGDLPAMVLTAPGGVRPGDRRLRSGGSRRVVHDTADGQRLLQPGNERDRLSGNDTAAAVLRRRCRRRRQLRWHRRGDRP